MTVIPSALQAAVVSLLVSFFWIGGHWLVDHHVWTAERAEFYITALATWCTLEGWAYLQRRKRHVEVNTALALPQGSTRQDVSKVIAEGNAPPANVPTDRAPYLKGDVEGKRRSYEGTGDGSLPPPEP